jgi:hypothetical protein
MLNQTVMNHRTLPRFWQHYQQLSKEVQQLADKNFDLLKSDPYHPSLHFKKVDDVTTPHAQGRGLLRSFTDAV